MANRRASCGGCAAIGRFSLVLGSILGAFWPIGEAPSKSTPRKAKFHRPLTGDANPGTPMLAGSAR